MGLATYFIFHSQNLLPAIPRKSNLALRVHFFFQIVANYQQIRTTGRSKYSHYEQSWSTAVGKLSSHDNFFLCVHSVSSENWSHSQLFCCSAVLCSFGLISFRHKTHFWSDGFSFFVCFSVLKVVVMLANGSIHFGVAFIFTRCSIWKSKHNGLLPQPHTLMLEYCNTTKDTADTKQFTEYFFLANAFP